jgi:peptidyl-prolyl cis-trans isomerase C
MNLKFLSTLAATGFTVLTLSAAEEKKVEAPVAPAAPAVAEVKADAPAVEAPKDLWGFLPPVVAKVGGKEITKQEFVDFVNPQLMGPDGKPHPMITPEMLEQSAYPAIKSFVDQRLLLAEAKKAGIEPSADLVKELIKKNMSAMTPEQTEQMKMTFMMSGKTEEEYISEMAKNPMTQQGAALEAYFEKEVFSKIVVTDADAKAYYEANTDKFKEPADAADAIRASHILIGIDEDATPEAKKAAKEKAEKILAEVQKDPALFAKFVKEDSTCPSKEQNGSLGSFPKGRMVKEFETAAFALKENEISGVVETRFGYHIIRRDASQPERQIPFDEIKGRLMELLKGEKAQAAVAELIAKVEKENAVEIMVKQPNAEAMPALQ